MVDKINISVAGYQGPASVHTKGVEAFGDALKAKLGRQLNFSIDDNILEKGHKSGDLLGMVERSEFDMCYLTTIRFSETIPECKIFELPFVINDRQKVYQALDGQLGESLKKKFRAVTPFHVLGFWDNGFRHVSNRTRPIRTPEDCEGLKIRTQMAPLLGEGLKELGFQPVQLDIKYLLEQIDDGDIDAQENPLTSIYNFNMHKHHRHITLTGHIFGVSLFLCNKKTFDGWSTEVQAAVGEAAKAATEKQRQLAMAQDKFVLSQLDPNENEVVHLSDLERKKFVTAVQPVIDSYRRKLGPDLFEAFL
jgi:TRAP-type transport system periplasmic protein